MISSVEEILKDVKKGKMYILIDDENRENEGDLIICASDCNAKHINFMVKYARGLVCMPITLKRSKELKLSLQKVSNSENKLGTAFTTSIEAREGVSTGISAYDRAKTISVATDENNDYRDISTPGHVFPLIANEGGVLKRQGHTEASIDIAKLANKNPSAVICEIMNNDGSMARLNDLEIFAKKHNLKITSIKKLIEYIKNKKK